MDVNPELISYIVTIILGILAAVFGKNWVQGKLVTTKFALAVKELADAIEDDRITQEEAERIVEAWKSVINEAKELIQK